MRSVCAAIMLISTFACLSAHAQGARLGEYVSVQGHPKAKGVNFKIKPPLGWDVEEGNRPNVVKKFTAGDFAYVIMIKDNITFLSRREVREVLADESTVQEILSGLLSTPALVDGVIMSHKVVTVDTYPALSVRIRGTGSSVGRSFTLMSNFWMIFYEDKVVSLMASSPSSSWSNRLDLLFTTVTASVVFPEQYD